VDVCPSPNAHAKLATVPSGSVLVLVKRHARSVQLNVNVATGGWFGGGGGGGGGGGRAATVTVCEVGVLAAPWLSVTDNETM